MARTPTRAELIAALEALVMVCAGEPAEVTAAQLGELEREVERQRRERYEEFDWREGNQAGRS